MNCAIRAQHLAQGSAHSCAIMSEHWAQGSFNERAVMSEHLAQGSACILTSHIIAFRYL